MTAERITPAAVAAERDVLDGEERLVLGEIVVSIGFTNAAVKTLAPREMDEVAAYLFALLARAPVKAAPAYQAHRMVLGALATELRGFAAAAGFPIGLEADLRAATSKAEERRIRERMAGQAAAYDRHVDDVIASHHAQLDRDAVMDAATHQALAQEDERADHEEEPAIETTAPTEPDMAAWLL